MRFAHDSYFYLGHSGSIRDSVAKVLPYWDKNRPNYGFVLGQYAFGLEECGDYDAAFRMGSQALERNPLDAWATHAVAHVYEMQTRQQEGVTFLTDTRSDWSQAQALSIHNGWHLALFLIELERGDEVLKYYDRFVAPRLEEDSLLDLVDASSLLWRLELAEVKVGSHRWEHLADQWMKHVDEHVLVFNDLHLAMAAVRAGGNRVSRLIDSMDAFADSGHGDNRQITAEVGRALVDAVIAFGDGDYVRTTELLLPVRYKVIRIGGSHAQRDVVTQTLMVAVKRSGQDALYRHLTIERVALRPTKLAIRCWTQLMAKHCLNSFKRGGKQFRVLTPTFGVKRHFVEVFIGFSA